MKVTELKSHWVFSLMSFQFELNLSWVVFISYWFELNYITHSYWAKVEEEIVTPLQDSVTDGYWVDWLLSYRFDEFSIWVYHLLGWVELYDNLQLLREGGRGNGYSTIGFSYWELLSYRFDEFSVWVYLSLSVIELSYMITYSYWEKVGEGMVTSMQDSVIVSYWVD